MVPIPCPTTWLTSGLMSFSYSQQLWGAWGLARGMGTLRLCDRLTSTHCIRNSQLVVRANRPWTATSSCCLTPVVAMETLTSQKHFHSLAKSLCHTHVAAEQAALTLSLLCGCCAAESRWGMRWARGHLWNVCWYQKLPSHTPPGFSTNSLVWTSRWQSLYWFIKQLSATTFKTLTV